jgi:hypothetical protein
MEHSTWYFEVSDLKSSQSLGQFKRVESGDLLTLGFWGLVTEADFEPEVVFKSAVGAGPDIVVVGAGLKVEVVVEACVLVLSRSRILPVCVNPNGTGAPFLSFATLRNKACAVARFGIFLAICLRLVIAEAPKFEGLIEVGNASSTCATLQVYSIVLRSRWIFA